LSVMASGREHNRESTLTSVSRWPVDSVKYLARVERVAAESRSRRRRGGEGLAWTHVRPAVRAPRTQRSGHDVAERHALDGQPVRVRSGETPGSPVAKPRASAERPPSKRGGATGRSAPDRNAIVTRRRSWRHGAVGALGRPCTRARRHLGGRSAPGVAQRCSDQATALARAVSTECRSTEAPMARLAATPKICSSLDEQTSCPERTGANAETQSMHAIVASPANPGTTSNEPSDEIVSHHPAAVADQQLNRGLGGAQQPLGLPAQRRREVLETGSRSGGRSTASITSS